MRYLIADRTKTKKGDKMNEKEMLDELTRLERKAINKYTDNIDFHYILETLTDDEQKHYWKLHKVMFG